MILYVDCDLHQVIQGAGARSPVNPIAFKSQDTPALNIYFVSQGVVLDLGESPVVEFGLVLLTAPTVFLSYNAAFTRQVDADGLVYYQAFPTFNTTETVAALAVDGAPVPLPVTGEIRYQLSDGEIVHTLNIPFLIWPTILVEGGTPDPTAIPGYPAVAAIELKSNKNVASGYAGLDSSGLLLLAVIPVGVELTANKNATNGYAGLIAGLLAAAQIPVDGITTQIVGGELVAVGPAQGVVAVTTDPFTVPAVGSTVEISVPVASLTLGLYYLITNGAGFYQYTAVVDSLHGTFTNVGGPTNAALATVIPYLANVSWAGPPGPAGAAAGTGSLSCTVETAFVLPTVGNNIAVTVDNAAMVPYGALAAIVVPGSTTNYGFWLLNPVDATHLTLNNDARWPAAQAGSTLPVGAQIIILGIYEQLRPPTSTLNGFIEAPTAKTYTIQLFSLNTPATIFAFAIKLLSGTCTASVNQNGTPISGLDAIAVTSSIQTFEGFMFGYPALAGGDLLELVISSPSSPVDLSYSLAFSYPVLF